jgi:type VI secretion system protein VasD
MAVCLLLTLLPACAAIKGLFGEKKPPPTEIEIKPAAAGAGIDLILLGSPLINPDANGVPSPMAVNVYFLASPANFAKANFTQLWERDAATLGPSMLAKHELIVKPSEPQRIVAKLPEGTTVLGITGGFRNFQQAKWRAAFPLVGDPPYKLKAELKTLAIDISVQD